MKLKDLYVRKSKRRKRVTSCWKHTVQKQKVLKTARTHLFRESEYKFGF